MVTAEGNNLVFLMSLPRSGSTLLSILMGGHSRMHAPPEPWFLLPLLHLAEEGVWPQDFGAAHAAIATREFMDRKDLMELTREFACGAYNRSLRRAGKSVFVDKTPRYYHISQELDALFPQSRRVWLVRNPFDVAASIKTTWKIEVAELVGSPLTQHSYDFLLGLPHIVDACRHPSPKATVVRYEELTAQPRPTMEALSRFLKLPFENRIAQLDPSGPEMATQRRLGSGDRKILKTKAVHTASVGAWEKALNREELGLLAKTISRDTLVQLGYSHMVPALEEKGVSLHSEAECREFRKHVLIRSLSKSAGTANAQIRQLTKLAARHEADAAARLEQTKKLTVLLKAAQTESAKRATQIDKLTALAKSHEGHAIDRLAQVEKLTALLKDSHSESNKRAKQITQLTAANGALRQEADARLEQIQSLTALTKQREQESLARATQIETLANELNHARAQVAARVAQLRHLTGLLQQREKDATARAEQVKSLTAVLKSAQDESARQQAQIEKLRSLVVQHESDSIARLDQINALTTLVKHHETESANRYAQIGELTALAKQLETESTARAKQIELLTGLLRAAQAESAARFGQIEKLTALVKAEEKELAERDAAERLANMDKLTAQIFTLDAENQDLRRQIAAYAQWLQEAQKDIATVTAAHREAEKTAVAALEELARLKESLKSKT